MIISVTQCNPIAYANISNIKGCQTEMNELRRKNMTKNLTMGWNTCWLHLWTHLQCSGLSLHSSVSSLLASVVGAGFK